MGHTDVETMANVTIAKYDFDDEAFQDISENAKDFIRKLLIKDMKYVYLFYPKENDINAWSALITVLCLRGTTKTQISQIQIFS